MIAELAFAFVAGAIATANPCGFALLPAYVARQLDARGADAGTVGAVGRALLVGALTTAGFLLVFGTVGTAMSLGARWLTGIVPWAALGIGIALVATGIAIWTGRSINVRLPTRARMRAARSDYHSTVLFGVGYGLASLACTLPIFLVVVAGSIPAGALAGALMFAAYAAGMGTILTALAVAAALSRRGVQATIRAALPYVERVSAVLLIAAGAYIVYYWMVALLGPSGLSGVSQPIEAGSRLSSLAQAWLASDVGRTVVAGVAFALLGLSGWVVWIRLRSRRRSRGRADRVIATVANPSSHFGNGGDRSLDATDLRGRSDDRA